jgi:uncharacterized membrane protein
MKMVDKLEEFHKTRQGHLVFGLIELGVAYLFASLAIDTGSLWQYAVTILLFIGAIQNFVRIFRSSNNDHGRR